MTNRYLEKVAAIDYSGLAQAYDNMSDDLRLGKHYPSYKDIQDYYDKGGKYYRRKTDEAAIKGVGAEHKGLNLVRKGGHYLIENQNPNVVGRDVAGRISPQVVFFDRKVNPEQVHEAMKDFHAKVVAHRAALGGKTPDFNLPLSDVQKGLSLVNRAHNIRSLKRFGLGASAVVALGGLGYMGYKAYQGNKPHGND